MSSGTLQPASVYLRPGELYVGEQPTIVSTLLGSCVSITMFSQRFGMGAICHAILPEGPSDDAFRYVDGSILHMVGRFVQLGLSRNQLEVKMFGGADLMATPGTISVGRRNIQLAREVLATERLTLRAEDTGGNRGRKIIFHTHTGEVWLRRLNRGEGILE